MVKAVARSGIATGVFLNPAGSAVTNSGTVFAGAFSGSANGITLNNGGVATNIGLIDAAYGQNESGVSGFSAAGATVVNTGTITAVGSTSGIGVNISTGSVNNIGLITGSSNGINVGVGVGASVGTVANYGTIKGTGAASDGIRLMSGGVVTNAQSGASVGFIQGSVNGVEIDGAIGSVINSASIIGSVYLTAGGSVTNTAGGAITGSVQGVAVGHAIGTVVNSGSITGTGTNSGGVYLTAGGSVTNTSGGLIDGTTDGIDIGHNSGTIVNLGTVNATAAFGVGLNLFAGGGVTNSGLISGNSIGLSINSNTGIVLNTGTITSIASGTTGTINGSGLFLGGGGTISNLGTVSAPSANNGVAVNIGASGGEIVNASAGLITASHIGVGFFPGTIANPGTLTLVNYGTIRSTQTGPAAATGFNGFAVQTAAGAPVTIANFGTIAASQTAGGGGVLLGGGGTVINEAGATINGAGGNALSSSVAGAAATVTNLGIILNSSTANSAVYLGQGGLVTNGNSGVITSTHDGVSSSNRAAATVVNSGVIQSSGTYNSTVYLGDGGTVTNAAGATVRGAWVGVELRNVSGSVTNSGTVISAANFLSAAGFKGVGVILEQGGEVTNAAGGLIAAYEIGVYIGGASGVPRGGALGTLVNYGVIAGTGTGARAGAAAELSSGGTITNRGLITSVLSDAVDVKGTVAGTVTNFGVITRTGSGTNGNAVYLAAGGTVTNYGLISGAAPGTSSATGYPGAIAAHNQPLTVRNFGTITNSNNGNGVNLDSGGTLINGSGSATAATISGMRGGVYIGGTLGTPTSGAVGTVVNYGTIENSSSAAQAVRLVSGGAVTNFGLINSARTGISFGNTAGVIDNFGSIVSTASTSFTSGAGVYLQNGGQITNEAGGSITAQRAAVSLGGTATTNAGAIVINSGVLTGDDGVLIGANDTGNNTIINFGTIIGTSGTAIDLGGDGAQIVSEPGSQLNGIIANFKAGDSIDLPGVNAFSLSYVNGVLSLFNQTTPVAQLGVSTPYINPQFSETADGNGGTLVTVAPPGGPVLFDFVYQYATGGDYYYGQVADDGTFGYHIGQQIATANGQYTILSQEPGAVSDPTGTVFVNYYSHAGIGHSHAGIGQASTTPLKSGEGLPDGAAGLGSESDFLLGPGGQTFAFSSAQEVSMPLNTLFGFVFTYADGSTFYSGTVSDNGSFGYGAIAAGSGTLPVSSALGAFEGSYFIYQEGTTALPAGTVTLNRYFSGQMGEGFAVVAGGGSDGLGSETGVIDVNGTQVAFGDPPEAALPASNPAFAIPGVAAADPATAVGEIYQQMLGRSPDASGLATYGAMLANGAGIATVQSVIAHSPEVQNDLNLAYQQVLGRNADSGGLAAYEDALAAGNTLANLRTMLAQSPEAQNDLNQLYLQVLGRDADNGGLNTYTTLLAQGGSLAGVREILGHSGEAQNDIALIYQQVLGRAADNGGLATYEDTLGGGWSLAGVRSDIAHSAEAQADLARLFDGTVNRDPNAAELAGAETRLAQGGALSDLQNDLLASGSAGGFTAVAATSGDASLSAAPGPTAFLFSEVSLGRDTIQGFDPTQDAIVLSHAQAASAATVLADAASTGAGTLITLNPGQSILLQGVAPSSLPQNNFQIV